MADHRFQKELFDLHVKPGNHPASDYFAILRKLVGETRAGSPRQPRSPVLARGIDRVYSLIEDGDSDQPRSARSSR